MGGSITKTGAGTTLTLPGSVFVTNLTVNAGNVDVPGRLRTTNAPVISSGATLTLRNQSASLPNGLTATVAVPVGATLEGLPGAFTASVGVQSTLNLTGGSLNLGIGTPVPGLNAHLYTGNNAGANTAFNTFANFSAYFAGRGPGLVTSTGANAYPDLSFGSGFGNTAMYAPIAPTFTATDFRPTCGFRWARKRRRRNGSRNWGVTKSTKRS